MVKVILGDNVFEQKVDLDSNLVVQAGIKKFPFPHLKYKCGMGSCGTCASKIVSGGEGLIKPTWKEIKVLKDRLDLGYRLVCQFRVKHDLIIKQEN